MDKYPDRSAYLIIEDSEDKNRRLFLQAKNNLGPKEKGLAFRVEQRLIPGDILASNISWESDHVTAPVDEALLASETRGGGESRSGKDEAADFLRSVLSAGPMAVADIGAEARAAPAPRTRQSSPPWHCSRASRSRPSATRWLDPEARPVRWRRSWEKSSHEAG